MRKQSRYYKELSDIVIELGGQMHHEKLGRPHGGSWVVSLPGHSEKFFDSNGAGFPPMDRLYVPKVPNPSHYSDYANQLVPGARDRWIAMLKSP
jgi:hypothetical protein